MKAKSGNRTAGKAEDIGGVKLGAHDGRLSAGPAPEIVNYVYRPMFDQSLKSFHGLIRYHLAYTLMLMEQKLVTRKDASKILSALLRLEGLGLDKLAPDPIHEELHPNVEAWLVQQLGYDVGGQLNTGRARRECQMGGEQLVLRDRLLDVMGLTLRFGRVLAQLSHRHVNDVMPYYTWFQQAEPITLGYFFSAYLEATLVDVDRLWASYDEVNLSRCGVGQVVPTSFPISRARLAELLGFAGQIENSLYGYSSFDIEAVLLNALLMTLTHACRMSDDLYVWTTQEFGLIEFGDAFSGTSFIMPHKKNPHALRFVRMMATRAQSTHALVANLYMDTTPMIRGAISLSTSYCFDTMDEVSGCLKVLTAALPTLKFNGGLALKRASEHYAQSVQLVNTLVTEEGVSFRTGHQIVGKLVREALEQGLKSTELTLDMLRQVARQELGRDISLSKASFKRALDPAAAVDSRKHGAGPAPKSTTKLVRKWERALSAHEARQLAESRRNAEADQELRRLVKRVTG
jgi:argininosuccinate lyase